MGDKRCCCRGCEIFIDEFVSALDSRWNVISGIWSVVDNRLREGGTPDAKIICNTPNPNGIRMVVSVMLYATATGDVYRIYVNSQNDDITPSPYAQLKVGDPTAVLSLHNAAGIVLATRDIPWIGSSPDSDCGPFTACFTEDAFVATVGSCTTPAYIVWHPNPVVDLVGFYSGLGNGGSSEIEFNIFAFMKHFFDDVKCPNCICTCYDPEGATWEDKLSVPGKILTATFVNCTGTCSQMEGNSLPLTYEDVVPFVLRWSVYNGIINCIEGTALFDLILDCFSYPDTSDDWTLAVDGNCIDNLNLAANTPPSTCQPLYLLFGPYTLTDSDLMCPCCGAGGEFSTYPSNTPGTYWLEITE